MRCFVHDDKNPSLVASIEHGGWACKSCGETGSIVDAWMRINSCDFVTAIRGMKGWLGHVVYEKPALDPRAKYPVIDQPSELSKLKASRQSIVTSYTALRKLKNNYGIDERGIQAFKLGFHRRYYRLFIPVYHEGGLINIRKHDIMRSHCVWLDPDGTPHKENAKGRSVTWDSTETRKLNRVGAKVMGVRGHNACTLFPSSVLDGHLTDLDEIRQGEEQWIVLTGGELKAIYLNQEGVPAVCFTSGEGSYTKDWIKRFRGLDVEVCMDADAAGVKASEKLAKALKGIARRVRIVKLPFGDVNDYYKSKKWVFDDWYDLPREHVSSSKEESSVTIPFMGLRRAENYNKEVNFRSILCGAGETPHFVLESIHAKCERGVKDPTKLCKECSLPSVGYEESWTVPEETIIELKGKAPKRQEKYFVDEVAGIPWRCAHPDIKSSVRRVSYVGLAQDVNALTEDATLEDRGNWFVHQGYYIGEPDPHENEPHVCHGKVISDPSDGTAAIILRTMKPVKHSYENTIVDDDVSSFLDEMPGGNITPDSVATRLAFLVDEFGEKVCEIYQQNQLVLGSLMCFFMPLKFYLASKVNQKVGAEVLFIGDTRAGKTTVNKALLRHFRTGRFIGCEGATFAGLVGGADSVGSKRFFTWGALPTQDRGIVVLDEIDDIVTSGIFARLTSIRSDGVASRTIAGGLRQCSARLRMVMLTNPARGRSLRTYSSSMFAIKDLLQNPQDIARFEYAVGIYRNDDPNIYNRAPSSEPLLYSSHIAAQHLRWAWQNTPNFKGDILTHLLAVSTRLGEKYRGLDILPPSEIRWKLARTASAIAAMCYSHDGDGKILVNQNHIEVAYSWFDGIYGSDWFAYDKIVGQEVTQSPEVKTYLARLGVKRLDYIYFNDYLTKDTIQTIVFGVSSYDEFIKKLVIENPCLVRKRTGYVKSDGFRSILDQIRKSL